MTDKPQESDNGRLDCRALGDNEIIRQPVKPQESETPECDDFIAATLVDHGKSESTIAALQGWTRVARSLERRLRAAEEWKEDCKEAAIEIAKLQADVRELERVRSELTKAIGLASTIKGDMEIDLADPIGMMQQVCAKVSELEDAGRPNVTIQEIMVDLQAERAKVSELEERLANERKESNVDSAISTMQFNREVREVYALQSALDSERKARREAEEALEKIEQWSHAYPLDVFPEPDLVRAAAILKNFDMTLDSISAWAMRHVVTEVGNMARAALKREGKSS